MLPLALALLAGGWLAFRAVAQPGFTPGFAEKAGIVTTEKVGPTRLVRARCLGQPLSSRSNTALARS